MKTINKAVFAWCVVLSITPPTFAGGGNNTKLKRTEKENICGHSNRQTDAADVKRRRTERDTPRIRCNSNRLCNLDNSQSRKCSLQTNGSPAQSTTKATSPENSPNSNRANNDPFLQTNTPPSEDGSSPTNGSQGSSSVSESSSPENAMHSSQGLENEFSFINQTTPQRIINDSKVERLPFSFRILNELQTPQNADEFAEKLHSLPTGYICNPSLQILLRELSFYKQLKNSIKSYIEKSLTTEIESDTVLPPVVLVSFQSVEGSYPTYMDVEENEPKWYDVLVAYLRCLQLSEDPQMALDIIIRLGHLSKGQEILGPDYTELREDVHRVFGNRLLKLLAKDPFNGWATYLLVADQTTQQHTQNSSIHKIVNEWTRSARSFQAESEDPIMDYSSDEELIQNTAWEVFAKKGFFRLESAGFTLEDLLNEARSNAQFAKILSSKTPTSYIQRPFMQKLLLELMDIPEHRNAILEYIIRADREGQLHDRTTDFAEEESEVSTETMLPTGLIRFKNYIIDTDHNSQLYFNGTSVLQKPPSDSTNDILLNTFDRSSKWDLVLCVLLNCLERDTQPRPEAIAPLLSLLKIPYIQVWIDLGLRTEDQAAFYQKIRKNLSNLLESNPDTLVNHYDEALSVLEIITNLTDEPIHEDLLYIEYFLQRAIFDSTQNYTVPIALTQFNLDAVLQATQRIFARAPLGRHTDSSLAALLLKYGTIQACSGNCLEALGHTLFQAMAMDPQSIRTVLRSNAFWEFFGSQMMNIENTAPKRLVPLITFIRFLTTNGVPENRRMELLQVINRIISRSLAADTDLFERTFLPLFFMAGIDIDFAYLLSNNLVAQIIAGQHSPQATLRLSNSLSLELTQLLMTHNGLNIQLREQFSELIRRLAQHRLTTRTNLGSSSSIWGNLIGGTFGKGW